LLDALQVKEARREVQQRYGADIMGVRGPQVRLPVPSRVVLRRVGDAQHVCVSCLASPQWTCSTLPDSKYTTAASDSHLANQVLPSAFQPQDMRRTRSPPRRHYDTQHYHAFTRGDAAGGWCISTETPSARQLAARQAAADAKAAAGTAKRTARLKRSQSPSLMQREEAHATGQRQQKEAAAAQAADLLHRFGPEGAAAMQHILAMCKPDRPVVRIRASKADVEAVQQLPPLGLADAE
jgi:hypothetical protein